MSSNVKPIVHKFRLTLINVSNYNIIHEKLYCRSSLKRWSGIYFYVEIGARTRSMSVYPSISRYK